MNRRDKKVIFVCTANTCRSPMAEMILKYQLKREGIRGIRVCSAGLDAYEKQPMNVFSITALKDVRIPRTVFYSKRVTRDMLAEGGGIIICMTRAQAASLQGYDNVCSFFDITEEDIPDPYGENADAYRAVCSTLLKKMAYIKDYIIKKLNGGGK